MRTSPTALFMYHHQQMYRLTNLLTLFPAAYNTIKKISASESTLEERLAL